MRSFALGFVWNPPSFALIGRVALNVPVAVPSLRHSRPFAVKYTRREAHAWAVASPSRICVLWISAMRAPVIFPVLCLIEEKSSISPSAMPKFS